MPYFGKYVSSSGVKNLLKYEYRGSDDSIIYTYITNPMYKVMVEWFPRWLAPNLITLIGFFAPMATHMLMWYYCPKLEGEAPPWVYVVCAFALIFYQTLDALDGKQARRTGTSSPLGLLFDHGCDATNTTMSALTMASAVQTGPTWQSALLWGTAGAPFFFATWEEYYTGELHLPVINGPNEGLWAAAIVYLLTAVYGPHFWVEEGMIPGWDRKSILLCVLVFSAITTILTNIYNVIVAVRVTKSGREERTETELESATLWVAVSRAFPVVMILIMAALWIQQSPSNIMDMHPRFCLWTLGLLLAKLVIAMMVSHLCDEEYHPFSKTMSIVFFLGAHNTLFLYSGIADPAYEKMVLFEFFGLSLLSYCHLVVGVCWEVSRILNIPIFTIPHRKDP